MTWRQMIRAIDFRPGDEIIIKGHPCVVVAAAIRNGTDAAGAPALWVWIRVANGPGGVQAFRPDRRLAGQKGRALVVFR